MSFLICSLFRLLRGHYFDMLILFNHWNRSAIVKCLPLKTEFFTNHSFRRYAEADFTAGYFHMSERASEADVRMIHDSAARGQNTAPILLFAEFS